LGNNIARGELTGIEWGDGLDKDQQAVSYMSAAKT